MTEFDFKSMNKFLKRWYVELLHISFHVPEENVNIDIEYFEDDISYFEENLKTGKRKTIKTDHENNIIDERITYPIDRLEKYGELPNEKDFSEDNDILIVSEEPKRYRLSVIYKDKEEEDFLDDKEEIKRIWEEQELIYDPPLPYEERINITPTTDYLIYSESPVFKKIKALSNKPLVHWVSLKNKKLEV